MKKTNWLCRPSVQVVLAFAALWGWSSPAFSSAPDLPAWLGVVTYVVDGDSVHVRPADGGRPVRIRVDGIDAPEICQPGGQTAREALKRRALGQRVAVHGKRHDDFGRLLARIELKDRDLGQWMVVTGQAWSYRYRSNKGPYALQQRRAQAEGLGIFSRTHAVPAVYPGMFRKQHGTCHPQRPRRTSP